MEFEEYLKSKKIDPVKFKSAEEDQYNEFKTLFNQIHPNSFTHQKLFLINKIRRKYHFKEDGVAPSAPTTSKMKPKINPKPKIR